jgi:hypothetical protein
MGGATGAGSRLVGGCFTNPSFRAGGGGGKRARQLSVFAAFGEELSVFIARLLGLRWHTVGYLFLDRHKVKANGNEVKVRECLLTSPRGGLQMKSDVRVCESRPKRKT